jgi:RNA polymerase sigma-70 factor (ECF subfamily)
MMPATVDATAETTAITVFVERHQRGLWRWLLALGCDAQHAEEHVQDALLAALRDPIRHAPDAEAARWLRTAARHLFWMRLRSERRRPPVRDLDAVEAAWLAARGDEDGGERALAALRICLEQSDARDQQALALRYERGASRAAMAAQLGVGDAGVKMLLRRARQRLRDCIDGKLQAEESR